MKKLLSNQKLSILYKIFQENLSFEINNKINLKTQQSIMINNKKITKKINNNHCQLNKLKKYK